jgi:hypothetical protein
MPSCAPHTLLQVELVSQKDRALGPHLLQLLQCANNQELLSDLS